MEYTVFYPTPLSDQELTDENIRACLDAISDDRAAKNIYGAQIWNLMDEWRPDAT